MKIYGSCKLQNEDGGWGLTLRDIAACFVLPSATFVCVFLEKGLRDHVSFMAHGFHLGA